jgi:putative transposase
VLKKRLEWFGGQLDLDPDKLVFIDESVLQRHGRSSA